MKKTQVHTLKNKDNLKNGDDPKNKNALEMKTTPK